MKKNVFLKTSRMKILNKKVMWSMMVVAIAMVGCSKMENPTNPRGQAEVEIPDVNAEPNGGTPMRLRCTWSEWGRESKSCDGGGLCNFS